MRFPRSWSIIPIAWLIEKIIGFWFYWIIFGLVLRAYGIWAGAFILFGLQVIASLIFLWVYDIKQKDIFGIVTLKAKYSRHFHQDVDAHPLRKAITLGVSFLVITWQCMPPLVVICFRHGDRSTEEGRDLRILFFATTITTTYWTVVHVGVIRHIVTWVSS